MKKPIPSGSGLALTELIYGSEQEQTTGSKIRQSRRSSKPRGSYTARLHRYEMKKAELKCRNLSPQRFEQEIKKLAERLAI